MRKITQFSDLTGCHVVKTTGLERDSDLVEFYLDNGQIASLHHVQDCCEYVCLEEIIGDASCLQDCDIFSAEEVDNVEDEPSAAGYESCTWTFYKIQTNKGFVTLRWFGTSNGCYSESVDFDVTEGRTCL